MDRQYGVLVPLQPALVDDLLGAALDFRVAALHGVKVQIRRIGASGHGAGRAAAHADAHARSAKLHQQTAGREFDFVGLAVVDHTQTARNHDGLVVAALNGINVAGRSLLVFAKVA